MTFFCLVFLLLSSNFTESCRRLYRIFAAKAGRSDTQTRFDVIFEISPVIVKDEQAAKAKKDAQRAYDFADGEEERQRRKQALRRAQSRSSVRIDFSPSCEAFEQMLMDSVTEACESVRNQTTLEHKIVTLLPVPTDVPLLDVGRGNERFSRVDAMVESMRARTVEAVRQCFQPAQELVARFEPFLHVFDVHPEEFATQQLAAFDSNMEKMPLDHPVAMKQKVHPAIRTVVEATMAFHRISDQLPGVSHDDEFLGMFKLRCADFKAAIALRSQEIVDAVCTKVYRRAFEMHTRLTEQYKEILARIEPRAKSEQEMQALREFADQVRELT